MVIGRCTDVFRGIFFFFGGGGVRKKGYVGGNSLGEICRGGKKFKEGSVGFSSIIIKKTMKK